MSRSFSERMDEGSVGEDADVRIETVEDVTLRRSKRERRTSPDAFDSDMEAFTEFLRRADEARSSIEMQRLAVEREHSEFEKIQRGCDREEHFSDRQNMLSHDISKCRVITDVFRDAMGHKNNSSP